MKLIYPQTYVKMYRQNCQSGLTESKIFSELTKTLTAAVQSIAIYQYPDHIHSDRMSWLEPRKCIEFEFQLDLVGVEFGYRMQKFFPQQVAADEFKECTLWENDFCLFITRSL